MTIKFNQASFRDPDGSVFSDGEDIYRLINRSYHKNFNQLMKSGLYKELTENNLLVKHKKVNANKFKAKNFSGDDQIIIQPDKIHFITYPYEWSFSQLKQAALLTLKIQKIALKYNMTLKDASSYNIQFINNKPIFIDTLSFTEYAVGDIWIPYAQFCKHFVAPLALVSKKNHRLINLLKSNIDGIPLDLACQILPYTAFFNLNLLIHLKIHSISQKSNESFEKTKNVKTSYLSSKKLNLLIEGLVACIESINLQDQKTQWDQYYSFTNYETKIFNLKKKLVDELISKIKPKVIIDLGGNDGTFTKIAARYANYAYLIDSDFMAIERSYTEILKENKSITSAIIDLNNPSPNLGFNSNERDSFISRVSELNCDCIISLALMHHICISNNVPFIKLADFYKNLNSKYLLIEYVGPEDSQVQKLLSNRENIFLGYNIENFVDAFKKDFTIIDKRKIGDMDRVLFLMKRKK